MPDRDKIPQSVPKLFKGVYQQIDEQQNPDSIADSLIRAIEKDIKRSGKGVSTLITQVTSVLSPLCQHPLLPGVVDWVEEHDRIDNLADQIKGNTIHKEWVREAAKQILNRLELGEPVENLSVELRKERFGAIAQGRLEGVAHELACNAKDYSDKLSLLKTVEVLVHQKRGHTLNSKMKPTTGEMLGLDWDLI